ncbi:hypothetical protein SAMN06265368_0843 [Cohaesibacter gelatinilyticus]|uniref:Uncharacterized protein n=1 Tax=Cohaesibacter gelatinilyticus TaxID=372072 RepID=A0A285NCY1_9HYPH|nr:hypothetical protein SAMN06265368_0843 [Cohaesibacter gelatinilyticus]
MAARICKPVFLLFASKLGFFESFSHPGVVFPRSSCFLTTSDFFEPTYIDPQRLLFRGDFSSSAGATPSDMPI